MADADEYFFAYESFLVELAKTDCPEAVFGAGRAWLEALHDHLDREGSDQIPKPVANQAVYYSRTLNGIPLAMGRTRRIFSPHQYRAMVIRDGQFRGPGCHAPPSRCEAHHFDEWSADHGETNLDRGFLLCIACHRRVHKSHWNVTGNTNTTLTYTDGNGKLIGTGTPRKSNQQYLTQLGQDHHAIQKRITELIQTRDTPPSPSTTPFAA